MASLKDMPNIGPVAAEALEKVGIETPDQLREIGAKEAWLRIRAQVDPGACLHLLQGLEAAVEGIPKKLLPAEKRAELNAFFKNY
ncbi:MAG TPA: TfoX/Sxy family protein [Pseudoflavonifractor sp.]|jgi:DNA transformation protein|nr:TfoX/Sxy family protein [Pseudoflavonifractor sp.]